jgi:HSP20 family protein
MKNPPGGWGQGLETHGLPNRPKHWWDDIFAFSRSDFQTEGTFVPACDVEEIETHYLMCIDMPGVARADLKIEITADKLIVAGRRLTNRFRSLRSEELRERSYGRFERVFNLPANIDRDHVEAAYRDGVLEIALPKRKSTESRQVTVGENRGLFDRLLPERREV